MKDLNELRIEIDEIDQQLLDLFATRIKIVREVGEWKKANNKPIRDPQRESEKIESLTKKAEVLGLKRAAIQKLWQTLFEIAYEEEK